MILRHIRIITILVFAALLVSGAWTAAHKPLWNDEYYSLISSTLGTSYSKMAAGGIEEGNNSPLYYVLQKMQCDIFAYHAPESWVQGKWTGEHRYSQGFLRAQSVLFVALSLGLLFYYFSRRYSMWAGLYVMAVALSSLVMWQHWFEARPYALWFLLSVCQSLLLLRYLDTEKDHRLDLLMCLTGVHCLLALTVTISIVQIAAAALVLLMPAKRSWRLWGAVFVIPAAIDVFYYLRAPKYGFFFVDGPMALISANFPKERLLILPVFLLAYILLNRNHKQAFLQTEVRYFAFMALMLAFFAAVLWKLKLAESTGFQISSRYFLSLAPLSIIGTTIFSVYLMCSARHQYARIIVGIFLVSLLLARYSITFHWH